MADLSNLTYSSLQTAVTDWLARADLTTNIPDFILLFENEVNRSLRVRQMEAVTALTPLTTSGDYSLPSDYLTRRRVTWTGTPNRVLEYVAPDILYTLHPIINNVNDTAGIPSMFTIERNSFIVRPLDAGSTSTSTSLIELDYYQQIPALASQGSTGTNWLLTNWPDIYLAGAMTEAYVFQKDWDQAGMWKQRRDDTMERLKTFDQKTRGPSAVRPDMRGRIP